MAQPTVYAWNRLAQNVSVDQGNASNIRVEAFTGITFLIKLTALSGGTSPSVTFAVDYLLQDGTYIQVAAGSTLSATGNSIISIGPGLSNAAVSGVVVRLRWTVTGAPTTATADMHMIGETDY